MKKAARDDCPCNPEGWLPSALMMLALTAVRLYRVTPRRVRCHRAGPSCSAYMLAALQSKGLLAGLGDGFTYWSQCRPKSSGATCDDYIFCGTD